MPCGICSALNPQLVAVTAKLENTEAKLPFFLKLKLFKFKVVGVWDECGGEKGGDCDLTL